MEFTSDINDYIAKEYQDNVIPAISEFIKIPNQSREFDPEWKTNGVQQKVCSQIVEWVKKQGLENMTVEILDEKDRTPAVLITVEAFGTENPRNVLLYGHLDKQPPLTDEWDEGLGPYTPVIKDGKLYGRGGVDDGYAIFCCVMLVKALQKFKKNHDRLVLFFETDEESGSQDLGYYLTKKKDVVGDLALIVCLDSGTYNYERFCLTTALRGVTNFTLKCEVTEESHDAEIFGNVIPEPSRILRKALLDFQDVKTGQLPNDFYVDIPAENMKQCEDFVKELDGKVDFDMPILDGVDYLSKDPLQLVLNNVWRPSLTLIGGGELPPLQEGGHQIRRATAMRLSLRLPPTLDTNKALQAIKDFFENYTAEQGIKITVEDAIRGDGFKAPAYNKEFLKLASKNAKSVFEKEMLFLGVGGSIPFMNEFYKVYPKAQFFITGMVGPGASIHAPNECLDIEYGKKLFQTLCGFLIDLADLKEQFIY